MRGYKYIQLIFLCIILVIPCFTAQREKAAPQKLKAIEIEDILAWKSIRYALPSNDGQWFAYRLSPNKGDSEVVIRETKEEKEFDEAFPSYV